MGCTGCHEFFFFLLWSLRKAIRETKLVLLLFPPHVFQPWYQLAVLVISQDSPSSQPPALFQNAPSSVMFDKDVTKETRVGFVPECPKPGTWASCQALVSDNHHCDKLDHLMFTLSQEIWKEDRVSCLVQAGYSFFLSKAKNNNNSYWKLSNSMHRTIYINYLQSQLHN